MKENGNRFNTVFGGSTLCYLYAYDDVGGADRGPFEQLACRTGNDDFSYPPPRRADAFFADFASAGIDVDPDVF